MLKPTSISPSPRLNDAAIPHIAKFNDLAQLILSGNDIKTLEGLAPLYELKTLEQLELQDNPVTQLPEYRNTLFEK